MKDFNDLFPSIVEFLTTKGLLSSSDLKTSSDWFQKVVEYNVPFGKKTRGMTVVEAYSMLSHNVSDQDYKAAQMVGWCVEFLQGFFLVCDDVMDQSITRRGKHCWYKKDGVGLIAINDALFLEQSIYAILKEFIKPVKSASVYLNLLELFHETTMQTVLGQSLDILYSTNNGDFSKYTMDNYKSIVQWKTAYYSFYLPIACALYLAEEEDKLIHNSAKDILLKMGEFFQIQDDFLDCYGDPKVTGKIGTDIQDSKCSWLVVKAFQIASEEQIVQLKKNYGIDDVENIKIVKEIFSALSLEDKYHEYEELSYTEIKAMIEQSCHNLDKELYFSLMNKIYKRSH